MNIRDLSLEVLKKGYTEGKYGFTCNHCEYTTNKDEVYAKENHFFHAEAMMKMHILENHQSNFNTLLNLPKKLNTLTDNQKVLFGYLYAGKKDKEISNLLGVSESTIRHQRFTLKEKANQAKIFLALYELLEEHQDIDDFLAIHTFARQVDERYMSTNKDKDKVLQEFFLSVEPLKLKAMPRKEKYKIIVLSTISELFQDKKKYTEKEVNSILKDIYEDYVTIRRYLIEYAFLHRTNDGTSYYKINI